MATKKNAPVTSKRSDGKRRVQEIAKRVKLEVGDTFEGTFQGIKDVPFHDKETDEDVTLTILQFVDGDGTACEVKADAMLSSWGRSSAKEGKTYEITKLPQTRKANGQPLNQYEIYRLE
jgi:hypothetical protein